MKGSRWRVWLALIGCAVLLVPLLVAALVFRWQYVESWTDGEQTGTYVQNQQPRYGWVGHSRALLVILKSTGEPMLIVYQDGDLSIPIHEGQWQQDSGRPVPISVQEVEEFLARARAAASTGDGSWTEFHHLPPSHWVVPVL